MNAEPDWRELNAFVDGELGLARQLEIEARLREGGPLGAQVEGLRNLRESLRSKTDYHAAPAALRARIAGLGAAAPEEVRSGSGRAVMQRWFAWRPLLPAFAIVALLAVALNVVQLNTWRDERLQEEVVASHVRATLAQRLVDVASSDLHTVKPFLSSRLDFSPPVRELGIPGSTFLGGRVDYLDGRPVAALVYRQGQHVIDSFVWPTTAADSRARMSSLRGFRLASWSHQGMNHWLISDVNAEEFAAVVRELEAAPLAGR